MFKKIKSISRLVPIMAACILGLSAASISNAQSVTRITYVSPSPSAINSFPIFVAIGEGYFKQEGIEVKAEAVNGSGPVLQALSSGQAQLGRPGPAPLIKARARGVDVVFIYNSLPRTSFGILVKTDSKYKQPSELKGKTIGVGTADGAEVGFARSILGSYSMKEPQDYKFIPVGDGGPATAGFLRGDIEAYVGSVADAAILNSRGMKVRDITPEKFQVLFGNGYAMMGDYIKKNPKVVEGIGRALVKATIFTRNPANREKVLQHLAAGNRQEIEDKNFANALLDAVLAKGLPFDQSKGWGYNEPSAWQNWHESMLKEKELDAPLKDLSAAYTNAFSKAWNTVK
jgi:NitT/TauT family transport system substrate-binding protein